MLKYKTEVNDQIKNLITATRNLHYGELFGVEIGLIGAQHPIELSKNEHDLVEEIRNGLQNIDVLTVHNGEPVLAEVDFIDSGFRCRKRIRFPTIPTEG